MLSDVWKAWGAELAFTSVRFLPSSWKRELPANSLPVQWLGLFAFTTGGAWVRWELRSCKQCGATKKKRSCTLFNSVVVGQVDGLSGPSPSSWGTQGPAEASYPPPHLPVPLRELRGSYSLREDLLPVV